MSLDNQNISWPGWNTVRLIGRGSFGAVYEIQREIFGTTEKAALKVISIPQNAGDIDEMYSDGYDEESITSTFQNHLKSIVAEYSMMRKMNGCPNIVNCDDVRYVQHDDQIGWDIFIKMELLTPLPKVLQGEISEETVFKIAKDICSALTVCKLHGIIHRDIKPQNIFLSPYGDYKLGDFGIAKTVEKTMGGTKIGTYKYMAPEVYNNKPYGCAADIYSLGLVLYWLLNERRMPFLPLPPAKLSMGMDDEARMRRLSGEQFTAPKNGSKELKAVIMKACAYRVEDRYASAAEMLEDLNKIEYDYFRNKSCGPIAAAPVNPMGSEDKTDETAVTFEMTEYPVACDMQRDESTVYLFNNTEKMPVQKAREVPDAVRPEEKKEEDKADSRNTEAVPKRKKKILPMILTAAAAVLIAAVLLFLPDLVLENKDNQLTNQNQSGQAPEVIQSTETPEGTETVPPTKAFRDIPDGTVLMDESWDKGDVVIVALDDATLWIQITDNRPDQQYGDLGTPWNVSLDFGTQMRLKNSTGGYAVSSPFRIRLESLAAKALHTYEYEQGHAWDYISAEDLKNLVIWETEIKDNAYYAVNQSSIDFFDIEQNNNKYTAIITLPEWFDASVFNDLTFVNIYLYRTSHYSDLYQNGSTAFDASYRFTSNGK